MLSILVQGLVVGLVFAQDQEATQDSPALNALALSLPSGQWVQYRQCGNVGYIKTNKYDQGKGLERAQRLCAEDCERDGRCKYATVWYSGTSYRAPPFVCNLRTAECGANVEDTSSSYFGYTRSIYAKKTEEQNAANAEEARVAAEAECVRTTGQSDCVPKSCKAIWPRSVCLANEKTLGCVWDSTYAKCSTAPNADPSYPACDVAWGPGTTLANGDYNPNCCEKPRTRCDHCFCGQTVCCAAPSSTNPTTGPNPTPPAPVSVTTTEPLSPTFEMNALALTLIPGQWTSERFCGTRGAIRTKKYKRAKGLVNAKKKGVRECEKTPECRYLTLQYSINSSRSPPYRCTMRTEECGSNIRTSRRAHWEVYVREL